MNTATHRPLNRLLHPHSIAVIGGKHAARVIRQCDRLGFKGEIWPVNPNRAEMESRACYRSLRDLPETPDAAFVAVPRRETVETVRQLAAMGAGGAVCYASGFAEVGGKGNDYQQELDVAMGGMPLVGPNCYGVLNYQDGIALWPDEQGGSRCRRGVAIISQSGNITVSLSMQRRGVPTAFLISTGNMSGVKTHDYIHAMLDNPDITAIGLYLEGVVDAPALSVAAIDALTKRVPIVVLESGHSEVGAGVTRTHSYSLSSNDMVSSAFYRRYGIIQVGSIPQLLETLKLVSLIPPNDNRTIASISCSGGEAALMADLAAANGLQFAEFSDAQTERLKDVLGDKVAVSNPLDYHTYIWGDQNKQTDCFRAVYEGSQYLTVNVIDFPTEGICDPLEWGYAIQAIADAKSASGASVAAVATLHENFSVNYQSVMLEHGIPPMLGMEECVAAIAASAEFARKANQASSLVPLTEGVRYSGEEILLPEYQGKQLLREAGFPVVEGVLAGDYATAKEVADEFGYPVVAKVSSSDLIHKSDVGGVILGIDSHDKLFEAFESLSELSNEILIERQMPSPCVEMLAAVRFDAAFGPIMVIGAGGKFANLIGDSAVLHFPIIENELTECLNQLKVGNLLDGYRGMVADKEAVLKFVTDLADHAAEDSNRISEIEINPLHVYESGSGVIAVDVVCKRFLE